MYSRQIWLETALSIVAIVVISFVFYKASLDKVMSETEISQAMTVISSNGHQCEKLISSNKFGSEGWQIECTNATYSMLPDNPPGHMPSNKLKYEVAEI